MSDDNGWGATFHRHFASNEIHRDGGPECTQSDSPRQVYVFDPDILVDHDRRTREEALREAAEALELKGNQYIESADRYQGYYAGVRVAYQAAAEHLRTVAANHVALYPAAALPCTCEATEDHTPDQTKVKF
ncbi:hypothetical protein BH09ACT9_BH09ACT9_00420 [soil metagenome]